MADSGSESKFNKFVEELGETFTQEDRDNIKKAFKGLAITLENKDDLKKAIEALKSYGSINGDKAAEMQQAAEETRAFRENMIEAQQRLREDFSSFRKGIEAYNKYQEDFWSTNLANQKKLIESGQKSNSIIFAQSIANSIIDGFGKDQSFRNLFGSNDASKRLSEGISGMFGSFRKFKEGFALLKKDSATRQAFDAKRSMNEAQKDHERLKQDLALAREKLGKSEKGSVEYAAAKELIKDISQKYIKNTEILSKAMADLGFATERLSLGNKEFKKRHEDLDNDWRQSREGFRKNILDAADVSSKPGGHEDDDGEQTPIKSQLQQSAESKEEEVGGNLKKTIGAASKSAGKASGAVKGKKSGDVDSAILMKILGGVTGIKVAQKSMKSAQLATNRGVKRLRHDITDIEKTKTPNNYPQVMGALALWLEESLKDKDETEKKKKDTDSSSGATAGAGGPGLLGGLGHYGLAVAGIGAAGYLGWKLGNAIGDHMDNVATERELAEINEKKQKEQQERADRLLEYAQADDEGKDKIAKKNYEKYVEGAEKVNESKARQQKLIAEKNEALKSGDTKTAQKLLEKIAEEREKMLEYSREREKYKEIIDKDNARKAKSKSEVDMKKAETGAGKATLEVTKQMATDMHTLVENMPQMVSAGTAAGINNA